MKESKSADMVQVIGGTFQMGSATGKSNEKPLHSVTLGAFYIEKTLITHEKWTEVCNWCLANGYNDLPTGKSWSTRTGTNHPVTQVSWYDVLKWCNARSEKEGLTPVYCMSNTDSTVYRTGQLDLASDAVKWTANGYRLPTEAEWEFAARGGAKTQGFSYSGSKDLDSVAWHGSNSGRGIHPVATKEANELGLYDMSGNVWEWCWDLYGSYEAAAQKDPKGPTSRAWRPWDVLISSKARVLRGGCYVGNAAECRVASRDNIGPKNRAGIAGFRCVCL